MHIGFGSTPSRSTMIILNRWTSAVFYFFKLLYFPRFISQLHQKSYIKIWSSIRIELFYIIARCNRNCTGNIFTMMSQHVRVKTSTRTCRPLRTYVSWPRHVRVEVNLVLSSRNNERIFHEKVQEFFTKTKETGISAERPVLNLSKIFYRIGYNGNATTASF